MNIPWIEMMTVREAYTEKIKDLRERASNQKPKTIKDMREARSKKIKDLIEARSEKIKDL